MKRLFAALVMLAVCNTLMAQDYRVTVENTKDTKLTIKNFVGDLPIEGYAGNEIIVTNLDQRDGPPERAKGLKPVFASGTDNSGIGVSVEKSGNQITIECLLPFNHSANYKIKVPENIALSINSGCERNNELNIKDVKGEIEINNCHNIVLKNVSGPLVLSTISGDITVALTSIPKDKPTSIASVSGDVDVTLPATIAANLEMSTISGNMYSDFELSTSKNKMQRVGGSAINTTLGSGGGDLKLTTVSGNVYLRKAK